MYSRHIHQHYIDISPTKLPAQQTVHAKMLPSLAENTVSTQKTRACRFNSIQLDMRSHAGSGVRVCGDSRRMRNLQASYAMWSALFLFWAVLHCIIKELFSTTSVFKFCIWNRVLDSMLPSLFRSKQCHYLWVNPSGWADWFHRGDRK